MSTLAVFQRRRETSSGESALKMSPVTGTFYKPFGSLSGGSGYGRYPSPANIGLKRQKSQPSRPFIIIFTSTQACDYLLV